MMVNNSRNLNEGFSLVETLVYLGLFGIVILGIVLSAFNMFELSGRTQSKTMLTAEGEFLLNKINNALTGASSVSLPVAGSSGNNLSLINNGVNIVINLNGANLELSRGSGFVNLNNADTVVLAPASSPTFIFSHTGSGTAPEFVTARFTLQTKTPTGQTLSQDFFTTKYLNK